MTIYMNQANYELARERIESGRWSVDPSIGHIIGPRGQPLLGVTRKGYVQSRFTDSDTRQFIRVMAHRVIWEYVNGPIPPGMTINHRNGIKSDNRITNLELVTMRDNIHHAMKNGLRRTYSQATHCRRGHEFTAANTYIRPDDGSQVCRACGQRNRRRYYAAKKGPAS